MHHPASGSTLTPSPTYTLSQSIVYLTNYLFCKSLKKTCSHLIHTQKVTDSGFCVILASRVGFSPYLLRVGAKNTLRLLCALFAVDKGYNLTSFFCKLSTDRNSQSSGGVIYDTHGTCARPVTSTNKPREITAVATHK